MILPFDWKEKNHSTLLGPSPLLIIFIYWKIEIKSPTQALLLGNGFISLFAATAIHQRIAYITCEAFLLPVHYLFLPLYDC